MDLRPKIFVIGKDLRDLDRGVSRPPTLLPIFHFLYPSLPKVFFVQFYLLLQRSLMDTLDGIFLFPHHLCMLDSEIETENLGIYFLRSDRFLIKITGCLKKKRIIRR